MSNMINILQIFIETISTDSTHTPIKPEELSSGLFKPKIKLRCHKNPIKITLFPN